MNRWRVSFRNGEESLGIDFRGHQEKRGFTGNGQLKRGVEN